MISKASILSNYFTSTLNCIVALLAVVTVWREFKRTPHLNANKDLVEGPISRKSEFFYFCFMAYVIYDSVYEGFLSETAKLDFIMLAHHALYFTCTSLLYFSDSLVFLTAVLMAQEFSTPFVNAMHSMKIFHMENTTIFTVNVALMTFSFFVFRVVLPVYGFVHVFLNVSTAGFFGLASDESLARTLALGLAVAGQCMQIYWFGRIFRGLVKHLSGEKVRIPESAVDDEYAVDQQDQHTPEKQPLLINPDEAAGVF